MANNSETWKYFCPICNEEVATTHSLETVKAHIGSTCDCINCNGLLMIEEDLTVSDFGEELVKRYSSLGITVSKKEATGTFVEF